MRAFSLFSKKLISRIDRPLSSGFFLDEEGLSKGMRVVCGEAGSVDEVCKIALYFLVDEDDGIIADAKFQVYGPPALIGAAESACDLLIRKNYDQARRVSAELLDKQMRDRLDVPAFPETAGRYLNLVLEAIENGAEKCLDIPFADTYAAPPITSLDSEEATVYPGWESLSEAQQMHVVEEVIASDIRPYVELDAGGVSVQSVVQSKEVIIVYQGACTTCYSSTGATLTAIQQILRRRVHPELVVVPNLSVQDAHH